MNDNFEHHKSYPWKFRTFMKGDRKCRLKWPLHKWRVSYTFTSNKEHMTHALWRCLRCGTCMNTTRSENPK